MARGPDCDNVPSMGNFLDKDKNGIGMMRTEAKCNFKLNFDKCEGQNQTMVCRL